VVICEQHAFVFNKVEQVGHLFQVRGDIGIVACEVGIVELDVDYVLDIAPG